ncbi:hypothetical protein AB3N58_06790 [Leptospira sp. WS60.C2]
MEKDFNSITLKRICENFSKRINVRILRGSRKSVISMKLKTQMITERLNNMVIKESRDTSQDLLIGKIKRFNANYCSDPWVKAELLILDKLNLSHFYIDPRRVKEDISFSRFKKIQERINNYKIPYKIGKTFEKMFRNFRLRMEKTREGKSSPSPMDYRLADITQDMNLMWRNQNDIPYILVKRRNLI